MKFDLKQNELTKNRITAHYLKGFFSEDTEFAGLREGYACKKFYENATIYIEPQHLITGRLDLSVWREIVTNYISSHDLHYSRFEEYLSYDDIPKDEKTEIESNFKKMLDYSIWGCIDTLSNDAEKLVEKSGAALCQHYNGHIVLDYEYVLEKGFSGILDDLHKFSAKNGRDEFYKALELTVQGMQSFIARHSDCADALIENESKNYKNLELISTACKNIAVNPPSSFYEAVQLQWFIMGFGDYDSFGRYDQYMFPFYKKDVESGKLTREYAKEIIKDMLRRMEENDSIVNMTIGGVTPDGKDAVNELTYIILEATRELLFKGPNLCMRTNRFTTPEMWNILGENLATGQALPALYNDENFINMLKNYGIAEDDANNYTLAGCSQALIPGKSNFACDMGLYTPAKMLDLALHNGFDTTLKKQVGPKTGKIGKFKKFDDFYNAYYKQMVYCVKMGVNLNNQDIYARRNMMSCVRTMFTQGCIEKAKSIFEGGAVYNGVQGEIVGLTNTVNAMYAVKTLVYDKKIITLEELVTAIDNNFVGYESLRAQLINDVPKFGNDIDEVDELRVKMTREIYKEISSYTGEVGGVHWGGEVIFNYHLDQAGFVGALPDGKVACVPLADSAGASQGTDMKGLTSLLKSVAKLPKDVLCTSINLNLKFDKNLWDDKKDKIMTAFKTFFALGGWQLQINVLDKATLEDALVNPEKHRNLVVRVGGYSGYFTQLSEEMQREIISRTEY